MQRTRCVLAGTVYDPGKDPNRIPAIETNPETVHNVEMEVEIMDSDITDCEDNAELELEVGTDQIDFLDMSTVDFGITGDKNVALKITDTNNSGSSQPQMMVKPSNALINKNGSIVFKTNNGVLNEEMLSFFINSIKRETQQFQTMVESSKVQISMPCHTGDINNRPEPPMNQTMPMLCINADGTISIKGQSNTTLAATEPSRNTGTSTIQHVQPIATGPIVVKMANKDQIKEIMKSRNLQPVDINSPLYKDILQTIPQIPSVHHVPAATKPFNMTPINKSLTSSKGIVTYRNKKLSNTQKIAQKTKPQQMPKPPQIALGTISIKGQSNTTLAATEPSRNTGTSTIQHVQPIATGPIVVKMVNKDQIKEIMKSRNLQPVDINSPLYKDILQTIPQIPSVHHVPAATKPFNMTPINKSLTSSKGIVKYRNKKLSNTQKIAQKTKPQQMPKPPQIALETKPQQMPKPSQYAQETKPRQLPKPPQIVQSSQTTSVEPPQQIPFRKLPANTSSIASLQITIENLKREIKCYHLKLPSLRKKAFRLKQRLAQLKPLTTHPAFLKRLSKMSPTVRMLTKIQYKESHTSLNGRRFTEKEKKFACSLYQKDPAGYKFLSKLGYILPGRKTVSRYKTVLKEANSTTSNNDMVEKLKNKVRHMSPSHRFCSVLFDEKPLTATNLKKTVIDQEDGPIELYADHALVFVVKGIFKFYQVPVSYMYSTGPTNGTLLAEHLRQIISDLQSIGFKVLATICDHADNNRRAIELLINEARCDFLLTGDQYYDNVFVVNSEPIVAMYDPPHLIKGLRNHFMTMDLSFALNGTKKTAKWTHLQMMFSDNPEYKGKGLVNKLSEDHVYPNEEAMTITKLATQVFSQSVASYMRYMAEKGILPPESKDTADLLLFFDQLFDSFNGYMANTHKKGKPLLDACKIDSAHHQKWDESIETLKSMTFLDNGAPVEVPEIESWIWTIRSMKLLMKKLLREYKLPLVWPRHLNQDAVERVFRVEVNPKTKPKNEDENEAVTREDVTIKVIKGISRVNKYIDKITPK